jgi:hypothetical protein
MKWTQLNSRPAWQRWPVKSGILVVVVVLTLFPRLDRLPRTLARHRNPNVLIQPDSAALTPLITEFDQIDNPAWTDSQRLAEVERFVYRRIPYEWDWNLWGNADYFPTLEEAITAGREDCDGRAVIAASMLQHYGFEARLASDLKHVWVVTDRGATMSPGQTRGIDFSEDGPRVNWAILRELPDALAFGIAVFPVGREILLVVTVWLMLVVGGPGWLRGAPWGALMITGLFLTRQAYPRGDSNPSWEYWQWSGLAVIAVGLIAAVILSRSSRGSSARSVADADPEVSRFP